MSSVKIELDLTIVQEAIKTHTLSAVTAILDKHYDIPKMVKDELLREPKKEKEEEYFGFPYIYGHPRAKLSGKAMIEQMVKDAIHEQAEKYVKDGVVKQKKELEVAFRKMMAKSPDKLVKAFLGAIQSGVESDWSFEIDTKVSVKQPPRDYGD